MNDYQAISGRTGCLDSPELNYRKIIAIVPAYNEERFIGSVVLQLQKCVEKVFVVDDGSSDATAEIAETAGAVVIRHEQNKGKGAALNTGLNFARQLEPDIIVTLDADGQHLPEEMGAVAAPIVQGAADIVVGSRYLEKKSSVPLHRIWGHHFFNFMTSHTSGIPLSDSQSGFRAFSRRAFEAITFQSNSFSVESEMQFLASEQNLKMIEVPITIRYPDKPKRNVLIHGLIVLNGILRLIGQYRPMLFFGLSGIIFTIVGLGWAVLKVNSYYQQGILAVGSMFLSLVLALGGILTLFTGIILHSVRGLLLDQQKQKQAEKEC